MFLKMYSQPSNTFTASADGWTALCEGACPAPLADWVAINGNPGGCFKSTDNGSGTWFYNSSSVFNTDLSSFYGGYLNFNLKQNTSANQTNDIDVMIVKADGTKIVFNTAFNPGTSWTSYSVPLLEAGWKYSTLAGAAVTYNDFISFITTVNVIKIRGDYSSLTTETTWIDNVNITFVGVLPIELNYFTGTQSEQGVAQLTWETLSETNCDYFQIEKSSNGGLSFDSVGYVDAQGTTESSNLYNFYDYNFYSNVYYRLKQVDFDLQSTYSDIIYITSNQNSSPLINIYPNPATDHVTIENINSAGIPFNSIRVTDTYSNTVFTQNGISNNSTSLVDINVEALQSGTYFLSLISDVEINTYVFQVIH